MNIVPKFGTAPAISDTEALEILKNSNVMKQAQADKAKALIERRRELNKLIADTETAALKAFKVETKAIEDAAKEQKIAEEALAAARLKHWHAAQARSNSSFRHADIVDTARAELRETATKAIDVFISEMLDQIQECHRSVSTVESIDENAITGQKRRRVRTNVPSINARTLAIREAMSTADDLRLIPDQADVPEELEKLRRALPAIKEIEK